MSGYTNAIRCELEWQRQCLVTLFEKLNLQLPECKVPNNIMDKEDNRRRKILQTLIGACMREQQYCELAV